MLPAAVTAFAILLLLAVPILGNVILLLLMPTVIASVLLHAHLLALAGNRQRAGMGGPAVRRRLRELRQALFGAWAKVENIFPLIVVGILLVVLGLLAMFLFRIIGGQGVVSLSPFFELTPVQMGQVVMAYGAAALLWTVVAGALLWSLPLFVIRNMVLGEALSWGVRGFVRNAGAAITFGLSMAALLLPGAFIAQWLPLGHHIVTWLMLTLLAGLTGFGTYCSYRLVYADVEPGARSASSRSPGPGRSSPSASPKPAPRRG